MQVGGHHLIIDTPPDFRDQVLTFGVSRVDAVFITHTHADHIFGFDDLRRFCYMQKMVIPVYGSPETLASMRQKFSYVIEESIWRASAPRVGFIELTAPVAVGEAEIEPVTVPHGPMDVYGYVIRHQGRSFGYIPDCSRVDDAVVERLQGLDVMVLDALRVKPHPTHLCLAESLDALQRIRAKTSYLTHLCHDLEHEETQRQLPDSIYVAHDGLVVDI